MALRTWLEKIVAWRRPGDAEALLGDLAEETARRRAEGRPAADRFERRELVRAALGRIPDRARPPRRQGDGAMHDLWSDIRFAVRGLRRNPGFTAIAVLTLAVGIGADTAIWSVVDTVLLRPLPYAESERLVLLFGRDSETGAGRWSTSYPDFTDLRSAARSFAKLGALQQKPLNLTGDGEPERLDSYAMTHDFFPALGVPFAHGRGFAAAEDRKGAEPVAILSYALWQRRFGGDPAVVGRTVRLGGTAHTVVGVAGAGAAYPPEGELWVPLEPQEATEHRGVHNLMVLGRLAPGVSVDAATAEVASIAADLAARYPEENARRSAFTMPFQEAVVTAARPMLWVLLATVATVLLIAIVNVSSLLLGRAAARAREVATRRALGASRGRLLAQFVVESLVLTLAGAAGGVALAFLGVRALVAAGPPIPRLREVTIDGRVLAFTLAISLLTAFAFALTPLLGAVRERLAEGLRDGARGAAGTARPRLRLGLAVVEVALAVVLVTGAGLLARSFGRLLAVDPGFTHHDLLAVDLELPGPWIRDDWEKNVDFYARLDERLAAIPGVVAVGAAFNSPVAPGWETSFHVVGHPEPPPGEDTEANFRPVTPGYFETAGIPLRKGRLFGGRENPHGPGVVIVNEAFVRAFLPGEEPLGQHLVRGAWWGTNPTDSEIIGVVGDVRFAGIDRPAEPAMYFPHAQQPVTSLTFLLRGPDDPMTLVGPVRAAVRELDPDLPIVAVDRLGDLLFRRLDRIRYVTTLLGLFATIALVLAAIGVYGVLAYAVAQRQRELGVRLAIGASRGDVLGLVLRQGLVLAAAGVVLGGLGAWASSRLLESFLFETSPTDPLTFAAVAAGLAAVALLASLLPALRATRVDPVVVLRHE